MHREHSYDINIQWHCTPQMMRFQARAYDLKESFSVSILPVSHHPITTTPCSIGRPGVILDFAANDTLSARELNLLFRSPGLPVLSFRPFNLDRPGSSPAVLRSFSLPVVQSSRPSAFQFCSPPDLQSSSPPVLQSSSHPVFQSSSHPVFQSSRSEL